MCRFGRGPERFVETGWCRIEVDPTGGDTLLNGVVDPQRFDDLAALLTRFGLPFSLELYDDAGELPRRSTLEPRKHLRTRFPSGLVVGVAVARLSRRWAPGSTVR